MNIMRKPLSQRGPQLALRANATALGIRRRFRVRDRGPALGPGRRTSCSSPALESTRSGSRIAQIVASTKSTKA